MSSLVLAVILSRVPYEQTFLAIVAQESGGNPHALNVHENAVGILQIRPVMVDDCNRIVGYIRWTLADRTNPAKSREMYDCFQKHHTHPGDGSEQWARRWNGGPRGTEKTSTLAYWQNIQRRMK